LNSTHDNILFHRITISFAHFFQIIKK